MTNKNKSYIDKETSDALDGIRGLSAFIVLLAHFNQIFVLPVIGLNGPMHLIPSILSSYAVLFFFVLSGFVISSSIVRNIKTNSHFNGVEFLISRFARIYPPYIFSLFFSFIIYLIIVGFELHGSESYLLDGDKYVARDRVQASYYNYITSALMLPGFINGMGTILMNGSLWSISYEFWLYAMAFLVATSIYVKIIPLFILALIFLFFFTSSNYLFLYLALVWSLGAALFLLYSYIKSKSLLMIKVRFYKLIMLAFLLACISFMVYRGKSYNDFEFLVLYSNSLSYAFGFLCLITFILFYSIFLSRWFSDCEFFKKIGRYSYTLYLIHFPILLLAFSFFHGYFLHANNMLRFLIFVFLMLINLLLAKSLSAVLENTKAHKIKITNSIAYIKTVLRKEEKLT